MTASGPLKGVRVVEFAGIGPGPHCAMMLSDLGAEVLRIDRAGGNGWPNPVMDRGRASMNRQNAFARRIGLKALTLAINLLLASIAITGAYFIVITLVESGVLTAPDNLKR